MLLATDNRREVATIHELLTRVAAKISSGKTLKAERAKAEKEKARAIKARAIRGTRPASAPSEGERADLRLTTA